MKGVLAAIGLFALGCGDPSSCPCAGPSLNPSGEFANTLIRGRPPTSPFAGNTVAAIEDAAEGGFPYVEIDVRITADGYLLPCRHDDLATFSTCDGGVATSTLDALAGCTSTEAEATSLRAVDDGLLDAPFVGVYLDLKSTETAPFSTPDEVLGAVLALREQMRDPDSLVAMSYRRDAADALIAAGVRTGLKGYPDDPAGGAALIADAADAGAEMICVNVDALDDDAAVGAEELDVWLLPWAHAAQVDQDLACRLAQWRAGGLISTEFEALEGLIAASCG